jgi:hypothetical protein
MVSRPHAADTLQGVPRRARSLLSTNVKWQLGFQLAVVLPQEPDQTTEMIIVTMAEHEGIYLRWVNAQQIEIVVKRSSSEAEIHEKVSRFAAAGGLGMHG